MQLYCIMYSIDYYRLRIIHYIYAFSCKGNSVTAILLKNCMITLFSNGSYACHSLQGT